MKKIIYRTVIFFVLVLIVIIIYLSTIGIKTNKFNSQIISQVKNIEPGIELKLNDVSAKLNLLNFTINAKTVGADIIHKNKIIRLESVKSKVSINSFLNKKFALSEIFISTNSLLIKDLINFIRVFNSEPKLFIAEQFIGKGYIIANLKLEFDEFGKLKENYQISGLVNDVQISLLNKDLSKLNLKFNVSEKKFIFYQANFLIDKKKIEIPEIIASKKNSQFYITGKLNTKNLIFDDKEIKNLINIKFLNNNLNEIKFDSKSSFNFILDKNFKFKNINLNSNIDIDYLRINNFLNLKSLFPKLKDELSFEKQKIELVYNKKKLSINGSGFVLLQDEIDNINYKILTDKKKLNFDTKLKILRNPFNLDILNYKKDKNSDLELNFVGKKILKGKLMFNEISLKEKNKTISVENLIFSKDNKINDLSKININYSDKDGLDNNLKLTKKKDKYLVIGKSFNINSIIGELLDSKNNVKSKILNKDFNIIFDVENIFLDKDNSINNLKGFLKLNKDEISELNLESKFSNDQNIKFTIKDNGSEKVTTLYSHQAKPFVDRYEFIKGFEDGDLDFYSIKKDGITKSTLKIDNFKIQEIPVLAKLLTLASLQGIADLLTGEGIRFTDFEMKFSNKDKLMTIEELYAIGPAISILLEGYVQTKELISLRGTLVPATTVNRTISSIPLIGDILVGKKVGEGVFGVSFKIKGPPGNLETTVNPIKTLTPRFITRTLEKIKKN